MEKNNGIGHNCGSDLIPGPELHMQRGSQKRTKKKTNKTYVGITESLCCVSETKTTHKSTILQLKQTNQKTLKDYDPFLGNRHLQESETSAYMYVCT